MKSFEKFENADPKIQIFDKKNIDSLVWPETNDAAYAKKFIAPLIKQGISYYIDNINAEIFALKIENFVFPIVVVAENYDNSWVCSPYGQYIAYAKEFIHLVNNKFLALVIKNFVNGFGKICKFSHLNSVVYVNNWLFSTDIYFEGISAEQISSIVSFLKNRFPHHAIVFRSLNPIINAHLIDLLKNFGFDLIASRQVHITNTKNDSIFRTRILKSDLKLWREKPFEILDETQISLSDCKDLLNLYELLYIKQHSTLNPQFNHNYIQMMFDQKLLDFKVLKENQSIKGVAGYFERGGIMMCPFFGYDKQDTQHALIYRTLSTSLLLEAQKRGLIFHQSAGASFYKSIRRAESCLEFMAIYSDHLPRKQKVSWATLQTFINKFAIPYMKKY